MANFWDTNDGEKATTGANSYETPGTDNEHIPDGSSVLARITSAKWDKDKDFNEYISLEWTVAEPEAYANRKVWQKLWVTDFDPNAKDEAKAQKKQDNAKRMLAAIDANAGGKLAKKASKPGDEDLALAITNRPMVIKLKIWEMGDAKGNWIAAVSPRTAEVKVGAAAKPKTPAFADDLDDGIPF